MSLNWNISAVADFEDLLVEDKDGDKQLGGHTAGMVWGSMAVGLGKVTEDNVAEWAFRLNTVGGFLRVYDPDLDVNRDCTLDEIVEAVIRHVGLVTNVANETRAKWLKRWATQEFDEVERAIRRVQTKTEAA